MYSILKELRKKYNYTVADMAEKIGICKAYYCLIENGKRRLYYDLAFKIATIFNMKPDDIFYDNNFTEPGKKLITTSGNDEICIVSSENSKSKILVKNKNGILCISENS